MIQNTAWSHSRLLCIAHFYRDGLCNRERLLSYPSYQQLRVGVLLGTCNLSNPEPEAGQVGDQPGLHSNALPLKTKQYKQQQRQNQKEQFRVKTEVDTSHKSNFLGFSQSHPSCTFNL